MSKVYDGAEGAHAFGQWRQRVPRFLHEKLNIIDTLEGI